MAAENPSFSPNQIPSQLPVQSPGPFPGQDPGQFSGQPPPQGQGQSLQLHDIHLPEQVSDFPIAPGWWILIAIIVFTALWFYKKHKQKQQLNAIKNQALAVLANNHTLSAKECITLLKSAAMHYFNRYDIAKLYGEGFQTFLVTQLPDK